MIWGYIFYAVLAVFVYKSIPKPQTQAPPGIGEVKGPTSDSTRDIPVIFGTVDIPAPHVAWWGHIKVVPITKKGGKK